MENNVPKCLIQLDFIFFRATVRYFCIRRYVISFLSGQSPVKHFSVLEIDRSDNLIACCVIFHRQISGRT